LLVFDQFILSAEALHYRFNADNELGIYVLPPVEKTNQAACWLV